MKKILSIFCALIVTLSLAACDSSVDTESGNNSGESSDVSSNSNNLGNSSDSTNSSSDAPNTSDPAVKLESLPRMDGSTSAIPLEIGLRSGFLGIPYSEAKEMVKHTTTHDSFKRLINGEVDLIFSVPISEEQQKAADDAGVKLTMNPVAREGFVFVVNADNPVNGLTSDQLRKIYSGEITNWNQVGGKDEPIIPYQRNTDSGSQNYMTVFMGDTPLAEPKKDYIALGMGGLIDAVAAYDNSSGAIGYSVYSYAAQMYAGAGKVKLLAVDGVAPSKATMADESYPLLSCTYTIYTDKSPESARKFDELARSDQGQLYVLESGYLPVNGMEVPEKYLPYEAVGTGASRPADFKPTDKASYINLYIGDEIKKAGKYFEVDFLKNKELQSRINADIRTVMDRLCEFELPEEEREYREETKSYSVYDERCIDGMTINAECRNGYLSLMIIYEDTNNINMGGCNYFTAETLNYDLFSGKKIERYSDLFYKDEEFIPDVNIQFSKDALTKDSSGKKLDYSGILGEPRLFTIEGILLEEDNLYFDFVPLLRYDDSFDFHSPVTEYRDMKPLVSDEVLRKVSDYSLNNEWEEEYTEENGDIYRRTVGSPFHTDSEVKERDEFYYDLQKRAWDKIREYIPDWYSYGTLHIHDPSDGMNYYSVGPWSNVIGEIAVMFDPETLKPLTMEDFLGKNWRDYIENDNLKNADLLPICVYGGEIYAVSDLDATGYPDKYVFFEVPPDKINERYTRVNDPEEVG